MAKIPYKKPALTSKEQVSQLKSRGMFFDDEDAAEKFLSAVNYYRLSGYWLPFEISRDPHRFKPRTTFKQVVDLYRFDKGLRSLLFEGISIFEVSFRARWSYQMGFDYGSHSYLDPKYASDFSKWIDNMKNVQTEYSRSKEIFVKHFQTKYEESFPPIWVVCELFSLGTISCWYKNMRGGKTKDEIARFYGVDASLLESWIHCISVLRNHCAHQSRIVNKVFSVVPTKPKSLKLEITSLWSLSKKAYDLILLLVYLNSKLSIKSEWNEKIKAFLMVNAKAAEKWLDFPSGWTSESLWN